MLRTFIAIATSCPPPLARVLKDLAQLGSAVKTSTPRGMHCTLRFLGDTAPETVEQLGPALTAAVAGVQRFSASLRGMGAFPDSRRPNVIWAGLESLELVQLQSTIEQLARQFGFVPETRAFHPHVTLARVKHRPPPRLAELLQEHATTEWGRVDVDAVEFFKSTLTRAGSQYEVLCRAPLRR